MKKVSNLLVAGGLTVTLLPLAPLLAEAQAVPLPVAACATNPYCAIAVLGAGVWLLTNRNNQVVCTRQGCVRAEEYYRQQYNRPLRIDDPDSPVESVMVDYVWGSDKPEADRNCQSLLSRYGMKFHQTVRNSRNSRKWQCWGWSNHPETTHIPDRRR